MVLPSTKMAVFMGAHASNQENLLQNPTAVSPDWQTLNFALGLHYTLSDSMRLSLWGTHAYNPDTKPGEDSCPAQHRPGRRGDSVGHQVLISPPSIQSTHEPTERRRLLRREPGVAREERRAAHG